MSKRTEQVFFNQWQNTGEALAEAATVAVEKVLRVKKDEKVLIVTNPDPDVSIISQALYDAAVQAESRPVIVYQPVKTQLDFAEPAVLGSIGSEPDVLISMSAEKLGKDEQAIQKPYVHAGASYDHIFHLYLYGTKTTRSFWSPNITRRLFEKTVPVDYDRMKRECGAVEKVLDRAEEILLTNRNGTDLRFSVKNRKSFVDDGDFSLPGSGGNLPAGETFISPVVGSSEGRIVFDGSISVFDGVLILENPITAVVENGFITDVTGGREVRELLNTLKLGEEKAFQFEKEGKIGKGTGAAYAKNARNIGEFGIGLNPAADIVGNMLVDEKAYRTCHLAIGSNYDEDAKALIHLDGLVTEPSVTAIDGDGRKTVILDGGDFVL